jgi:Tfp pilus assembly PilM family ATPase
MVPEVARSLQYAAHRYAAPIADLTLTGEGAAIPGLAPRLRQQSIIEGAAMRVWSSELGSAAACGPEYACAIGLSMARRGAGRIRRAA